MKLQRHDATSDTVFGTASMFVRHHEVFKWKAGFDPTFLFLFSKQDVNAGVDAAIGAGLPPGQAYELEEFEEPVTALQQTAGAIIDRLDALGVSDSVTQQTFQGLRRKASTVQVSPKRSDPRQADRENKDAASVTAYEFDDWLADLRQLVNGNIVDSYPFRQLLNAWQRADARIALRSLVQAFDASEKITLDVSELVRDGWIDNRIDPYLSAAKHFQSPLSNGLPAIIITEGKTDADIIQAAIQVLRPHLTGFVRFLDLSFRPQGGAGSAVTLLKAFAAAGIPNRTLLLLDNDTAAHDAARQLESLPLPSHYGVAHYPDLVSASDYPTLGPAGLAPMNVNKIGGCIEIYLGEDVLTSVEGSRYPIQWTGYIQAMGQYQGQVMNKETIQDRFRDKSRVAIAAGGPINGQDWADLRTLLDDIIRRLASLGTVP